MASRTAVDAGIRDTTAGELRREALACQMDDLNALADAMRVALDDGDSERAAALRASMDRFSLALGWGAASALPAILAYACVGARTDDELFAPAFILASIAPHAPETARLLTRASVDCRALLSRLLSLPPDTAPAGECTP
jgi:hypothetical protein